MRIAILSRNPELYSTRRLAQAAQQRSHRVITIDTMRVALEMAGGRSRPLSLPAVEAIIPRIGASITPHGLAVVRHFEARRVATTATAEAIARSRDKQQSLEVLRAAGLPIPRTALATRPEEVAGAIEQVGGLPVVIKVLRGTQGHGVVLIHSLTVAESILSALQPLRERVLVQEYIREAGGKDVRVIVVGHQCVAAMTRHAVAGDFRANLHRGGTAEVATLNDEMRGLAVATARAHGLGVAGVDLILSQRGPLVLEVNSSPGLEGIERVSGQDVATAVIVFLEQQVRRRR